MTSIIGQIAAKIVTIWDDVVKDVEADVARIEAVLPGAKAVISSLSNDVKQGASDLIGAVDSELNTLAPTATKSVESALDGLLVQYTGGLALPLTGLSNDAIDKLSGLIVSTANAWALKAKAALAENNATTGATKVPQG